MTDFDKINDDVADETTTYALLNRGYTQDVFKAGQWFETTEEMYFYFLEVLPPKNFLGSAFELCEAAISYLSDAFVMFDQRWFCLTVEHGGREAFEVKIRAFREHLSNVGVIQAAQTV